MEVEWKMKIDMFPYRSAVKESFFFKKKSHNQFLSTFLAPQTLVTSRGQLLASHLHPMRGSQRDEELGAVNLSLEHFSLRNAKRRYIYKRGNCPLGSTANIWCRGD